MHNILIIGAGQLGSRHLQGALQSKLPLKLEVVDPSLQSLEVAELRASEITIGNINTTVGFFQEIKSDKKIDICIIATTANIRFNVFKNLIEKCEVKNIIFEKVLFQKEDEYFEVEKLLKKKNINAWVNCPRRINPTYVKIQKLLLNETNISMSVFGSGWGLACNGIHFIDLFSFITKKTKVHFDGSLLENRVEESKRNGFYEIFGVLSGKDAKNNTISLSCIKDKAMNLEVNITTENHEIIIQEISGVIIFKSNGEELKEKYTPVYQSQLTHLNIEEIIQDENSSLTSFSDSKNIHLPFISLVKTHLETTLNKQFKACPIT